MNYQVSRPKILYTILLSAYLPLGRGEPLILASRKQLWLSEAAQPILPDSHSAIESQDLRERRRGMRLDGLYFITVFK